MLKPKADVKKFEEYGFKPCKGTTKESQCYYLCVSRGCKMLFVSPAIFDVNEWRDDDTRIHKKANCRYMQHRVTQRVLCMRLPYTGRGERN